MKYGNYYIIHTFSVLLKILKLNKIHNVTCYDTSVRCLQVILTPTCHVSGYPRQVIKVATLLDNYALFNSVTNSYNTYNNYTTRHL
jgi:hypothetical protein